MSSIRPKILVVLTSHGEISGTGKVTGWFLAEFAHAYHYLAPHADIVVASPEGGEAPLSSPSIAMCPDDISQAFLRDHQDLWKNTTKLSDMLKRVEEFDAVYYPGGYGPMFDLPTSTPSLSLLHSLATSNKTISAVCHGQAALLNATLADGTPLLANSAVTGFPKSDDEAYGEPKILPFVLEDELQRVSGGLFEKSEVPLGEKVVVALEGRLITGQNPASVRLLAERVLESVRRQRGMGV